MSSEFPGEIDSGTAKGKSVDVDLLELEKYIQDIWRFLPVPICQLSPRGVILDSDRAFEELLGCSKDALIGSLLSSYFVDRQAFEHVQESTLSGGSVNNYRTVLKGNRQDNVLAKVSTLLRKDEEGQELGYFASFTDITEQEKANAALKESEEKYRTVVEHSLQGIIIVQGDPLRIRFANEALAKIFGYPLDELVQFSPEDIGALIHPDDREIALSRLQEVLSGNPLSPSNQIRIKRKDGSAAWIEIYGSRLQYQNKPAVQVSVVDITERKRIEEELKESEAKYRNLVEKSLLGIIIARLDPLRIYFANSAAARTFGYAQGEFLALDTERIRERIHPDDLPVVYRRFKAIMQGDAPKRQEIRINKKDGTERWVEIFGHRIEREREGVLQVTIIDTTERREAQRARIESELRYKVLFEKSPLSITIVDSSGRVLDCNRRTEQITGYAREEIVGKRFDELLTLKPETLPTLKGAFEKLAGGQSVEPYELEIIKKDGEECSIRVTNATVSEGGKIIGFQIIAADITGQKQVENELRNSEQQYLRLSQEFKGILDAIPDNLTFQGEDMRIVWANQAAAGSIEKEVDDVIGKRCFALWHGREEPCEGCPVLVAMKSKQPAKGEIGTPDGRHWEVRGFPILEDGRVRGAVEIARDISERKKMENALRESEEKYRLLLEQSGDIITYFNEDGVCLAMNRNAAAGFGSSPEGLAGRCIGDLFSGETAVSAFERIQRVARSGESEEHEDYVQFPRGEGWFRSSYHIVKGARGEVIGVQIISRDITERRKMEEELARSERMKLLAQLAMGVSHEVRNPLGAILASTEALCHDLESNSEYSEYLSHIRIQVNRLSILMKDLLELGKPMEEDTFENESLQMLCSSGVELWRQSTSFKHYMLQFVKPSGFKNILIRADGARIQQVCINLLENAAQNSPEGSKIMLKVFEPEGGTVRVQIIDEGSGINEDDLEKVFEPFFSTRKQGSGLGLSIVKQIIETHGGSVEIRNNEGGTGCTAEIVLPVVS
jgi:PAS domain S-box-containing protein